MARMDTPTGTFIAYSTAPGSVAMGGSNGNSPFTATLAKPANPKQVRPTVLRATSGKQTPSDSSSLVRNAAADRADA